MLNCLRPALLLPASSLVNPQVMMFSGFLSSSQALGVSCCNLRSSLEGSTPTHSETEATLKTYTEQEGAEGEGRGDWPKQLAVHVAFED